MIRWGRATDVVRLDTGEVSRAAGYIAKYATKATEAVAGGVLLPRIRSFQKAAGLRAPRHAKRLVKAAWRVGSIAELEGARRWAHQFGYGGHTLTKSRDYSVTFTVLRAARVAWKGGRAVARETITRGVLRYAGRGYTLPSAARLAGVRVAADRASP